MKTIMYFNYIFHFAWFCYTKENLFSQKKNLNKKRGIHIICTIIRNKNSKMAHNKILTSSSEKSDT